jgi:hypothetical protein
MSVTEDESQSLDAGWDAEEDSGPGEQEIDDAWDSLPPPVSGAPSIAPKTEEVDSGWDDLPAGAPAPEGGKRRPHRQRRPKSNVVLASSSPVLLPRPAEPTKKVQRELYRKQRAYEAQVKQQRKVEKKAQRATQAREEVAARLRQTEAEELARQRRHEARARAESQRPNPSTADKPVKNRKITAKKAAPLAAEAKRIESVTASSSAKSGLRLGVVVTLLVLAAIVALLVLRK